MDFWRVSLVVSTISIDLFFKPHRLIASRKTDIQIPAVLSFSTEILIQVGSKNMNFMRKSIHAGTKYPVKLHLCSSLEALVIPRSLTAVVIRQHSSRTENEWDGNSIDFYLLHAVAQVILSAAVKSNFHSIDSKNALRL